MQKDMGMKLVRGCLVIVGLGSAVLLSAMDDGVQKESLHKAIVGKNVDEVRRLIEKKADVNGFSERSGFSLEAAVAGRNEEIVALLLDAQADVNARYPSDYPLSLLGLAVVRGCSLSLMGKLIDAKADVNERDKDGSTPLRDALDKNVSLEVVEFLLKHKADPDQKAKREGRSPLETIELHIEINPTPERLALQQLLKSYSRRQPESSNESGDLSAEALAKEEVSVGQKMLGAIGRGLRSMYHAVMQD